MPKQQRNSTRGDALSELGSSGTLTMCIHTGGSEAPLEEKSGVAVGSFKALI
jgi:hypothetical protein